MDFQLVTSTLLKELDQASIRYAVIGGFALGLWEVTRATIDIDFLLLIDDLPQAESILEQFSYRQTYKSENVAQYVSDLAPYGQVDIIIAFRKVSRSMLERRVSKSFSDSVEVHTLIPEDLIGLKLQAGVNDPHRMQNELSDMNLLLEASNRKNAKIDWELLHEYFELFDKLEIWNQLKESYG